jgi:hypothetical protein
MPPRPTPTTTEGPRGYAHGVEELHHGWYARARHPQAVALRVQRLAVEELNLLATCMQIVGSKDFTSENRTSAHWECEDRTTTRRWHHDNYMRTCLHGSGWAPAHRYRAQEVVVGDVDETELRLGEVRDASLEAVVAERDLE